MLLKVLNTIFFFVNNTKVNKYLYGDELYESNRNSQKNR